MSGSVDEITSAHAKRSLGSVIFFILIACGVGFEWQAGNHWWAVLEFILSPLGAIHGVGHFAGFWP